MGFIAVSGVAVLNGLVLMGSIRSKLETEPDVESAILHGAMLAHKHDTARVMGSAIRRDRLTAERHCKAE